MYVFCNHKNTECTTSAVYGYKNSVLSVYCRCKTCNSNMTSNFFDDYHFSETTEIFILESSSDTMPSNLHDSEISDCTIGKALSSPLFTQEREEPAGRRQAYHSPEESLLSSQSLTVGHVRTERPVHERSSLGSRSREKPSRDSENEQIRILLERQREHILADGQAEIRKHKFQADYDRRSVQMLNEMIESPAFFPPHPDPGGMPSRSLGMPSRKKWAAKYLGHMVHRETLLQIQQRLLQHLIRKSRLHGVLMNQITHHHV